MPVLVHDGAVHIESNDILVYVDQTFPGPKLIPPGKEGEIERLLKQEDDLNLDLRALTVRYMFGVEAVIRDEERLNRRFPNQFARSLRTYRLFTSTRPWGISVRLLLFGCN